MPEPRPDLAAIRERWGESKEFVYDADDPTSDTPLSEQGRFYLRDDLAALAARVEELEAALKPFAQFAVQWQAKPIQSHAKTDATFAVYEIHVGTEWEARLTLGDFRRALAAAQEEPRHG